MMVRPYTRERVHGHFFIKYILPDGLAMVDQSPGPHPHLTSRPWISSCASMCRTVLTQHVWMAVQPFLQA
jgi:hypothetical protein